MKRQEDGGKLQKDGGETSVTKTAWLVGVMAKTRRAGGGEEGGQAVKRNTR